MKRVWFLVLVLVSITACASNIAPQSEGVSKTWIDEKLQPSLTQPPPTLLLPSSTSTAKLPPPTDTLIPSPEASRTPSVEKLRDLAYVQGGNPQQMLDIYLPTGSGGPFPVLLAIHGGGGDKADFASFAMRFVKQGYAVVAINHREMPKDIYPAAVQDAFCALAWMHAHADTYNLAPAHFFALGHSSGGTLVASLGAVEEPDAFLTNCPDQLPDNNWVKGVITFTGIFDYASAAIDSDALKSYINSYLGTERVNAPEIWAEASPVTWVDGSEPPFLIIHGEADRNIAPRQSIVLSEVLERAGVSAELIIIPDLDHGDIIWNEAALAEVEEFLNALIVP